MMPEQKAKTAKSVQTIHCPVAAQSFLWKEI
jgi:hypothetical protein